MIGLTEDEKYPAGINISLHTAPGKRDDVRVKEEEYDAKLGPSEIGPSRTRTQIFAVGPSVQSNTRAATRLLMSTQT